MNASNLFSTRHHATEWENARRYEPVREVPGTHPRTRLHQRRPGEPSRFGSPPRDPRYVAPGAPRRPGPGNRGERYVTTKDPLDYNDETERVAVSSGQMPERIWRRNMHISNAVQNLDAQRADKRINLGYFGMQRKKLDAPIVTQTYVLPTPKPTPRPLPGAPTPPPPPTFPPWFEARKK